MSPAADTPTLALVAYGNLWDASCAAHPRAAVDYSWQQHLRCLCKLARELHKAQPIALKVAGLAERMHIEALATVPVEVLILDIERDRISRPHLPADPLWWLDPRDSHLQKALPEPARAAKPRPYIQR
jgi:hypothetical protein